MSIRLKILGALMPITKAIGKVHAPFSHKRVTGPDVFSVQKKMIPGTILLSYTRGELTNLFIPGTFTHAAIALDERWIVEAVGDGVRQNDIISFMTSKDRVVALYLKGPPSNVMERAAGLASISIGAPYDYLFESGNRAFYCSELVQWCYQRSGMTNFTRRSRLGVDTIVPDDFYKASDKWELVWDSDLT